MTSNESEPCWYRCARILVLLILTSLFSIMAYSIIEEERGYWDGYCAGYSDGNGDAWYGELTYAAGEEDGYANGYTTGYTDALNILYNHPHNYTDNSSSPSSQPSSDLFRRDNP